MYAAIRIYWVFVAMDRDIFRFRLLDFFCSQCITRAARPVLENLLAGFLVEKTRLGSPQLVYLPG